MDFSKLQKFLEKTDRERDLPGSLCLVHVDGEEVFSYAGGCANLKSRTPMDMERILYQFSMTKPVTCIAALQLFEEGAFLMTDPLSEYLPEFKNPLVFDVRPDGDIAIRPAKGPIRIRDLFTMESGYGYPGENSLQGRMLAERFGDEKRLFLLPLSEFTRELAAVPLLFDPGTHWHYGYSHDILARLVEVLSGEKFSDYMEKHIFRPLGMAHTGFHLKKEDETRMATLYTYDPAAKTLTECPRPVNPVFESGGAGLLSTVPDYMKFADMLCLLGTSPEGVRILGSRTVRMMTANALREQQADFDWIHMKGYGYGYGVRTMTDPSLGGSSGNPGEFGWAGLAGTDLIIDPREKLAVVYGHQRIPNDEPYIHPRLRNIVYACL